MGHSQPKEREVAEELLSCQQRGVQVDLVCDFNRSSRMGDDDGTLHNSLLSRRTLVNANPISGVKKAVVDAAGIKGLVEVLGVYHVKYIIVDDTLILTGANLSEEYYTTREDRYVVLQCGSVQAFFVSVSELFANENEIQNSQAAKASLEEKLREWKGEASPQKRYDAQATQSNVIGWVEPNFNFPKQAANADPATSSCDEFINDAELLSDIASRHRQKHGSYPWIGIQTAYFNPTNEMLEVFKDITSGGGSITVITASGKSHGFYQPPTSSTNTRTWIPSAYKYIAEKVGEMDGVEVKLWEKEGWTFHRKGIWVANVVREERDIVKANGWYIFCSF